MKKTVNPTNPHKYTIKQLSVHLVEFSNSVGKEKKKKKQRELNGAYLKDIKCFFHLYLKILNHIHSRGEKSHRSAIGQLLEISIHDWEHSYSCISSKTSFTRVCRLQNLATTRSTVKGFTPFCTCLNRGSKNLRVCMKSCKYANNLLSFSHANSCPTVPLAPIIWDICSTFLPNACNYSSFVPFALIQLKRIVVLHRKKHYFKVVKFCFSRHSLMSLWKLLCDMVLQQE